MEIWGEKDPSRLQQMSNEALLWSCTSVMSEADSTVRHYDLVTTQQILWLTKRTGYLTAHGLARAALLRSASDSRVMQ
jgi:hypothetical protein